MPSKRSKLQDARNALNRHSRKCVVCHHPDRDSIEEEFIHWRSPYEIARQFRIADYRSIYRHARSTGILDLRRHNFYSALDSLVEAAEEAKVTGDCVIRAIRAYSCLDSCGHWVDPPTQVNFSTNSVPLAQRTPHLDQRSAAPNTKPTHTIDIAEPNSVNKLKSAQQSDLESDVDSDSDHESEFSADPESEIVSESEPAAQSDSEINSDSNSETDPQFAADSESEPDSNSDPNSTSTPDPAFIAELEAILASPVTNNPATRDLNLIYRRAIRTGLNYLKT